MNNVNNFSNDQVIDISEEDVQSKDLENTTTHDGIGNDESRAPSLDTKPIVNYSEKKAYYCMGIDEIVVVLETDRKHGLSEEEANRRLKENGKNVLEQKASVNPFKILLRHIFNFMTLVLIVAMVVCFAVQHWIDGGVIAFIVLFNIVVGFCQEYRSEKSMEALQKMQNIEANVIRNGQFLKIPAADVVVGDLVVISEGNQVPADLRIIQISGLECEEAILTGESEPIPKTIDTLTKVDVPLGDRTNMAFSGTLCSKGKGTGLVVATGMECELGAIAKTLNKTTKNMSKLQKRMTWFSFFLVVAAVICVGLIILGAALHKTFPIFPDALQAGISTAIAIVPEGLMPVLTLTMTYGVMKMAKQRAIVRKLDALESLGNITDICSDKTGTLTEGKMTLTNIWLSNDDKYSVTGTGIRPKGYILDQRNNVVASYPENLKLLPYVSSLCNAAVISKTDVVHDENDKSHPTKRKQKDNEAHDEQKVGKWSAIGSPTEVALQVFAHKAKMDKKKLKRIKFKEMMVEYPFDSTVKRMTVVYSTTKKRTAASSAVSSDDIRIDHHGGELFVFSKGAPERILPICTNSISNSGGDTEPLDEIKLSEISMQNELLASEGMRVLALAYRKVRYEDENVWNKREEAEKDLTFIGLVGIKDPPRNGVASSIQVCHQAGIVVRMITGDHKLTATSIAKQIGIIKNEFHESLVMTAQEFDKLSDDDLKKMEYLPLVIARCSPESKVKMVNALHARKKYIAMTGDGVNDAASILKADVGIAMGINGSDVTKQAADIILTDDDFGTIVIAVREGRRIFANIRKFIMHLLSGNVAESIVLVIGVLAGLRIPLNPLQILWANLVTTTGPAIGLSIEPVQKGIMDRKQRKINETLFSWEAIADIFIYGICIGGLSLMNYLLVLMYQMREHIEATSVTFATLTILLLFHAYNCRHLRRPFFVDSFYTAYFLHCSIIVGFLLLLFTIYVPFVNTEIFHQVPMPAQDWLLVLLALAGFVFIAEVYKAIKRLSIIAYRKIRQPNYHSPLIDVVPVEKEEALTEDTITITEFRSEVTFENLRGVQSSLTQENFNVPEERV
ncbi:hypothetical protein ABK040_001158 [Willaertia magna]